MPTPRTAGRSAAQNMYPSMPGVVPTFGATDRTNGVVAGCSAAASFTHSGRTDRPSATNTLPVNFANGAGPGRRRSRPSRGSIRRATERRCGRVRWRWLGSPGRSTAGIERVEVQVDGGSWAEAELAQEDTVDTWRQWVYRWDASTGKHTVAVRATDGSGDVQSATLVRPFPNGATGDHTIAVHVA